MALLAADDDRTPVVLNNGMADAEAEAHALADVFGRKERLEEARQVCVADAGAVVPDADMKALLPRHSRDHDLRLTE